MAKLTERQKKFIDQYMVDFIGGDAVRRSKVFKTKYPDQTAAQLLRNPAVQAEIARRRKAQTDRLQIKADEVLLEIKKLAFSDLRKAFNDDGSLKDMSEIPDDVAAALAGIDVDELFDGRGEDRQKIGYTKKIKLWDKLKALQMLGEHCGIFKPKGDEGAAETFGQIVKDVFDALNRKKD